MLRKNILFFSFTVIIVFAAYYSINFNKKAKELVKQSKMFMTADRAEKIIGFAFNNGVKKINIDFLPKLGWSVNSDSFEGKNYPADMSMIKKIVTQLNSENFQRVEKSNLTNRDYNLKIKFEDNSETDLSVYKEKAFDESVFIMSRGDTFVSAPFWTEISHLEVRQKEIFLLDFGLQEITLTQNKKTISYLLNEGSKDWISSGEDRIVKELTVSKFLKKIMKVKVFKFFDKKNNIENHRMFGLDQPMFQLKFVYKDTSKPVWKISISEEDHGKHYGFIDHYNIYFQLSTKNVNYLKESFNILN